MKRYSNLSRIVRSIVARSIDTTQLTPVFPFFRRKPLSRGQRVARRVVEAAEAAAEGEAEVEEEEEEEEVAAGEEVRPEPEQGTRAQRPAGAVDWPIGSA